MPRTTSGSGIRITAAICLDRADEAAVKALASRVRQSLPKHQYEILPIGDADLARLSGMTQEGSLAVSNSRWIERPVPAGRQDDPERFRRQISAGYDRVFCLPTGIVEQYYD